jgi:ribosomal protein L40E
VAVETGQVGTRLRCWLCVVFGHKWEIQRAQTIDEASAYSDEDAEWMVQVIIVSHCRRCGAPNPGYAFDGRRVGGDRA